MRPLIAGNWKMNGLARQLAEVAAVASAVEIAPSSADILLCLPATLIARAAQVAAGRIALGGQDCSPDAAGAFTGDVSTGMLIDAGASAVIVGHSERRRYHGETDVIVSAKAKAASRAGLLTIICIGETESQRADGKTLSVCADQIAGSVPDGMTLSATAIAHEPLWAIGSGRMPTLEEIIEVHAHIRKCLTDDAFRHGRQKSEDPLRRVGRTDQRARNPCTAGGRWCVDRWRKPQGRGLRSDYRDGSDESLIVKSRGMSPGAMVGIRRREPLREGAFRQIRSISTTLAL
jgi:triosephosphate isomerase